MEPLLIDPKTFTPNKNLILVKIGRLQKEEKKADSGIVLRTASHVNVFNRETKGEVIKVGSEIENIKPGYVVFYELSAGIDAKDADYNAYTIIKESSVVGYEPRK